jgi:hypothetical protein
MPNAACRRRSFVRERPSLRPVPASVGRPILDVEKIDTNTVLAIYLPEDGIGVAI